MADRWSNPSGGLGVHRFRVWPAGSDSYDHVELAQNFDTLDALLGIPDSGSWPPTTGVNGGIYALIKDLRDDLDDLEDDVNNLPEPATTGYSVTLPSSPTNGQEHILVDSITLPTYQWRFRYNAGSNYADKWEFVGGAPLAKVAVTQQRFAADGFTGWGKTSTDGLQSGPTPDPDPTFTIPRAGVYDIAAGAAEYYLFGASGTHFSFDIGDASSNADMEARSVGGRGNHGKMVWRTTIGTAGLVVRWRMRSDSGHSGARGRSLIITPVRVR